MTADPRTNLVSVKTGSASLADLKREYLDIEAGWTRTQAETAHKLGRVLMQIKEHFPHGDWTPWIEKNLGISPRVAQMRMRIATLPVLPNTKISSYLNTDELTAVAGIALRDRLSPDDAANRFIEQRKAKEKARSRPKPRPRAREEDDAPLTNQDYINNFYMSASGVKEYASYNGKTATQDMVDMARSVATAWLNLATKLEKLLIAHK